MTEGRLSSYSDEALCQANPESMRLLGQSLQAAACDGIAQARVTHEQYHWGFCKRIGYRAYRAMHASEDAQEEVEAYGAEIPILRAELARILERVNLRVVADVQSRTEMPPNPLYRAVVIDNRGEVRAQRVAPSGDGLKLDGVGEQVTSGAIEGSCEVVGMPLTIPARATFETDGYEVSIDYGISGTMPSFGARCRLPGGGAGSGMTMPMPISAEPAPGKTTLPLRNGAQALTNMADTPAARTLAAGGIRLTGIAILQLQYDCPPGR